MPVSVAQDGAVCGRPAAPGPGRAPPVPSSRLGPTRSGRRDEPTNGRPLRLPAAAGRAHPATLLTARRSRAGNCAPCSLTEGLPDCPQAVSRAPGRRQRAQGSPTRPRQPGMAAAGHPHPPLRLARQPQKGNGYTREGFNGKPRRPATQTARSSPPPRKPRPPAEGRRHTQQPTPPPHKPPHTPRDRPVTETARSARHPPHLHHYPESGWRHGVAPWQPVPRGHVRQQGRAPSSTARRGEAATRGLFR